MPGASALQKTTPVRSLKAASLAPAIRKASDTRGRIVWILDDALVSQRDIAVPKIEAVGGKVNLAIPTQNIGLNGSTMVAADITNLYQRGHQIMSHSVTHPDMTTLTPAQRQPEWDNSKTIIEGLTAVGAITDWVYPNNNANLATTIEAYGRYLRTYSTGPVASLWRPGQNGLLLGRATWGSTTHQSVLSIIRRIAITGETYVVFCHATDTAGTSSISPAMLDEAIALTTSLGVSWVRADEGLVGPPSTFLDIGFETGDLTGIYNALTSKGSGCTIDIVADAPAAGLSGVNSLRMVNDGSGSLNRVSVVGAYTVIPGEAYTLSGRMRQDKTSGTGGGQFIVRQYDEYGANLGDTSGTVLNAGGTGVTPWTQVTLAFTPNVLCRGFTVWCAQTTMVGTTWFDHLHFGPTRLGVLG